MAAEPPKLDTYIAALPPEGQTAAADVRATVKRAVPTVVETMKYGVLAFQLRGQTFLYAGIWKKHVGLYPIYRGEGDLEAAMAPYRAKTDTVRFL